MALVNRYVLLEYAVGGPRLWHERWVLEHIINDEYVVATPDRDVFIEDLSLLNDDLRNIRVRAAPGQVPAGIAAAQIYGVPAWNGAEPGALRAEARQVAEEGRRLRAGGAAVAGGGGPVAAVPGGAVTTPRWSSQMAGC